MIIAPDLLMTSRPYHDSSYSRPENVRMDSFRGQPSPTPAPHLRTAKIAPRVRNPPQLYNPDNCAKLDDTGRMYNMNNPGMNDVYSTSQRHNDVTDNRANKSKSPFPRVTFDLSNSGPDAALNKSCAGVDETRFSDATDSPRSAAASKKFVTFQPFVQFDSCVDKTFV